MGPHSALKSWLKRQGIKPGTFAGRIEYDRGNFHRLLKGEFNPSLQLAARIERETAGEVPMSIWAEAA